MKKSISRDAKVVSVCAVVLAVKKNLPSIVQEMAFFEHAKELFEESTMLWTVDQKKKVEREAEKLINIFDLQMQMATEEPSDGDTKH